MTTTEEVIRFAKDKGMYEHDLKHLARLVELIKAEENEACAMACSGYSDKKWRAYKGIEGDASERASDFVQGESSGSEDCAEAIRARRNHG